MTRAPQAATLAQPDKRRIAENARRIDQWINVVPLPWYSCKGEERMERWTLAQRKKAKLAALLLFSALTISACGRDSADSSGASPDWQRGRAVYVANCVACHNNDPSKDGPIGPALKGSPPELVEHRVLRTEYPPGYTPKRNTKVMPTFPFLKSEIKYLAEYLR